MQETINQLVKEHGYKAILLAVQETQKVAKGTVTEEAKHFITSANEKLPWAPKDSAIADAILVRASSGLTVDYELLGYTKVEFIEGVGLNPKQGSFSIKQRRPQEVPPVALVSEFRQGATGDILKDTIAWNRQHPEYAMSARKAATLELDVYQKQASKAIPEGSDKYYASKVSSVDGRKALTLRMLELMSDPAWTPRDEVEELLFHTFSNNRGKGAIVSNALEDFTGTTTTDIQSYLRQGSTLHRLPIYQATGRILQEQKGYTGDLGEHINTTVADFNIMAVWDELSQAEKVRYYLSNKRTFNNLASAKQLKYYKLDTTDNTSDK